MRWRLIGFCVGAAAGAGFVLCDAIYLFLWYRDTPFARKVDLVSSPNDVLFGMTYMGLLIGFPGFLVGCVVATVAKRLRSAPPMVTLPEVGPHWSDGPNKMQPSVEIRSTCDGIAEDAP
jgi:hypothetical protein